MDGRGRKQRGGQQFFTALAPWYACRSGRPHVLCLCCSKAFIRTRPYVCVIVCLLFRCITESLLLHCVAHVVLRLHGCRFHVHCRHV